MKLQFIYSSCIIALICFEFSQAQTYEELKRMQNDYKEALDRQSLKKSSEIGDAEEKAAINSSLPEKLIYTRKDIDPILVNTKALLEKLHILNDSINKMPFVGYEIFTKRDTIPFWQNLPIPKNYILGPGDEIIISLWGEVDLYNEIMINRDGQIYVENIGMINIAGKSIKDAKKYILSRYSRVYSTLIGNNPKSFLDISLGELKSVNVHFVGYVNLPGIHMIHPFSSVVMGLNQAGGISERGSLRKIQVIRDNQIIKNFDLYEYIFNGKSLADIRLMDQDIIFVNPRQSTIPLTGSVLKPGYYEMIKNETVGDLLQTAGGKDRRAASSLFLFRNSNFSTNGNYLLKFDKVNSFAIADGDSIHIPSMPISDKYVRIDGHVKNPGQYPFRDNMTLIELIDATMSIIDQDFKQTMDLSNIIIYRKNPTGKIPNKIVANLDEETFKLLNGDHISISQTSNFQPIEKIIITGEVKHPGTIAVNNITTLAGALELAGGLTEYALSNGVEIFRDSLMIGWESKNFILSDGDSLNILKKTGLVHVLGEVNSPGYVSFNKKYSLKKYINKAGGFTAFAESKNILIKYPNGIAEPYSRFSSPKVLEGSTIIVNERSLTGYMGKSSNEGIASYTAQAGSLATTLLSLMLIVNQLNGS